MTVWCHEGRAGIKPDLGISEHEWVGGKPRVGEYIADEEEVPAADHMSIESVITSELRYSQPVAGFAPETIVVEKADTSHRRLAQRGCQGSEIVKRRFGRRVENLIPIEGSQPLPLIH